MQIARQTFPKSIEVSLQIENSHLWTLSADANQLGADLRLSIAARPQAKCYRRTVYQPQQIFKLDRVKSGGKIGRGNLTHNLP